MLRRKKKFILGRGPVRRSALRHPVRLVVLLALVFVPWQAMVLAQTAGVTSRAKQALLGESITDGTGPLPVPTIRNLADPTHDYGIATGTELLKLDDITLAKRLSDIRAVGVGWLRLDIAWEDIQPSNGAAYNWEAYDRVIAAVGKQQLKMIGTLTAAPVWARGDCSGGGCPPANNATFASFAARAAARYQPMGLQVWEIWSEPNTARAWMPKPDAAAYARLLQAAYPAIRQANPQAIVISGGLAPVPTDDENSAEIDYLPQLYAAGAKGFFDAVGAHPYTYPFIPSHNSQQGWSRLAFTANNLRQTMTVNGDGAKKIWLTEFGAPTAGVGAAATMENHRTHDATYVDEELQAQIITKAAELYRDYDWVGPFIWAAYADPAPPRLQTARSYGIVREDGTKKPAYSALQRAITGQ